MHYPALPVAALLLLLLVFSSGCTDGTGDFPATPAPTPAPTTLLPTATVTERPATAIPTPPPVTTIERVQPLPPERSSTRGGMQHAKQPLPQLRMKNRRKRFLRLTQP